MLCWARGALLPRAAWSSLPHARGGAVGAEIHAEPARPVPRPRRQRCAHCTIACSRRFRERTLVQEPLDRFILVPIRDWRELEVDDVGVCQPFLDHSFPLLLR